MSRRGESRSIAPSAQVVEGAVGDTSALPKFGCTISATCIAAEQVLRLRRLFRFRHCRLRGFWACGRYASPALDLKLSELQGCKASAASHSLISFHSWWSGFHDMHLSGLTKLPPCSREEVAWLDESEASEGVQLFDLHSRKLARPPQVLGSSALRAWRHAFRNDFLSM